MAVHAWGGYALWKYGNDVPPSRAPVDREISLNPEALAPLAPQTPPPPPPPPPDIPKPPEPEPAEQPEPDEPVARLGIADSQQNSKAWIGYKDPTEHSARPSEVEQSAMSPAPGVPAPPGGQAAPAVQALQPAASPPRTPNATQSAPEETKPVELTPQELPSPSGKPEPREVETLSPRELSFKKQADPSPSRLGVDATAVAPQPETSRADPARSDPADAEGDRQSTRAEGDPSPAARREPANIASVGELSPEQPGTRDAERQAAAPPRKDRTPAPTPKLTKDVEIRPDAELRLEGRKDSNVIDPDSTPAGVTDGTPSAPLSDREPQGPPRPTDAELAESNRVAESEQSAAAAQAQAQENAAQPSAPQNPGVPFAGDRAAERDDREADASSIRKALDVRLINGRVAAGEGLEIRTVRPRFSTTTLLTSSPRNPVVWIRFGRDGRVADADFVKGFSTGEENIDSPLMDAILRWRASGKKIEELPAGDQKGVTLVMRIILR